METYYNRSEFHEWLKTNKAGLAPRTIDIYANIVGLYFRENETIDIEHINRFIATDETRRSTVRKYGMQYYLEFIKRKGIIKQMTKIRTYPPRPKPIPSNRIIEKIIRKMRVPYKIVAIIQYETGLRASDALQCNYFELKEDGSMIVKGVGKGNKEFSRSISSEEAKNIIMKYAELHSDTNYPFLRGTSSKGLYGKVINNYIYYYNELRNAAALAGVDNFSSHTFRRKFGRDLEQHGFGVYDIKQALGHSLINTTLRYLTSEERKHGEMAKQIRKNKRY